MSGRIVIDPLNTVCSLCDRKITVVQEWLPYRDSIVHANCRARAFVDWCSDRDLPVDEESFRAWLMYLDDEEPYFGDETSDGDPF